MLLLTIYACDDINKDLPPLHFEEEFQIEVQSGMNLIGRVLDQDENPIEGVVVSDGYTVTTTDSEGVYQMKKDNLAKFVFISTPETYEVPKVDNIPLFYRAIKGNQQPVIREDFVLTKIQKKDKFVLLALADVQIKTETHASMFESQMVPDIINFQQSYPEGTEFYGIALGDIVWDNFKMYPEYRRGVAKTSGTYLQVIGNHDHDQHITNDDYNASRGFEEQFGPTYYSYNVGDCHFVVLDDVLYQSRTTYSSHITEEQIEWLKKDLQYVDKDKLILLGVHIPTKRRYSTTQVPNNYQLYEALKGYKVRIMSGHLHHNSTVTISDNIEENNLGAVMGAGWVDNLCTDGSPQGYGVYEIEGNEIKKWLFKGMGTSADKRMNVYPPNSWPKESDSNIADVWNKSVVLNIWTWHYDWTVKAFEDDVEKAILTNYSAKEYDPTAFNLFYGDKKPVMNPGIEPIKHDHMFYYTPSSTTWNEIKIEATDSNGNVHTEVIKKE